MKVRVILAVVSLFFSTETVPAQLFAKTMAYNAFYLEALGMGGYGSVNYERLVVRQNKLNVGVRLGVGTYRLRDFETSLNPDITVPFSLNVYYGKTHYLEIIAGQIFTSYVKASAVDFKVERDNSLNSSFGLGYRYQKSSKGLLFRASYTPIVSPTTTLKHWYGLSIGYAFF